MTGENKEKQTVCKSRGDLKEEDVLLRVDEIIWYLDEGWSIMLSCRKAGGISWAAWRGTLLSDARISKAWDRYLVEQKIRKRAARKFYGVT